jgi:pyroglutamyl-peptidase
VAKHVLVTGFEPFGGDKINPSEMLARSLEGRMIAGRSVCVRVLPLETRTLRERFEQMLVAVDPDVVIATAQFGGRSALGLERVAVNILDFDQPDNAGITRTGDVVARGGADARISNLPFEKIVSAWHEAGVPGYVSNSAGTFIGNQTLYELLGLTEVSVPPVITGLLHLQYLPAQAISTGSESSPSMSLDLMTRGIEILIETIVPWVEQRTTPEAANARETGRRMWIPRGVKEVER